MIELLIQPLAAAFMEVGVFVALLVAPFGWARYRWGGRFDAALERRRRLGPLLAALMTAPPGCGGAIIVMTLYARGAVTYGAAIAALVATMGDACWLLLAAEPMLTLQLKVLLLTTGTVTGYLVDALDLAPVRRCELISITGGGGDSQPVRVTAPPPAAAGPTSAGLIAPADVGLGALPTVLWLALAGGLALSLPATFRLLDPAAAGDALLGGVDPALVIGAGGTVVCVIAFLSARGKDEGEPGGGHPSSMNEVLRRGGHDVAFVTVWVAAAYLCWSLISHYTGFDGTQLPLFGVLGVLVGSFVGLIPGCAIQIVFVGVFLAGGMPLSTLVANTISQDGDALIPLLALEHRSALLATLITTAPSLVVGSALLALG